MRPFFALTSVSIGTIVMITPRDLLPGVFPGTHQHGKRANLSLLILLACIGLGGLAGCDTPETLLADVAKKTPTAGVDATKRELRSLFDRDIVKFETMLRSAHDALDEGPSGAGFATAVLRLSEDIEQEFPSGGEYELFWRQVGQLAYRTAHTYALQEDHAAAWGVVLGGPRRWQSESYWRSYPNHDALTSGLMALFGDPRAALARLRSRTVVTPELEAAMADIRKIIQAKSGG